jgi:parallel beta-helix repeat protein
MRLYSVYVLSLLTAACFADVLNVPSEQYPSIQQAINAAIDGDEIIVAPGRYFENINFLGKVITVSSQNPNDPNIVAATIIDGNSPADVNFGSVVTFKNGETNASILEGFTITGGTGSWLQVYWEFKGYLWNRCGGGIVCSNYSSPTIRKNIITANLAGQGGGIYCYNHSNAIITDNTISDNNATVNHGFVDPDVNDANIYDHGDGGAIVGFQYCDSVIKNNTIQNNHAQSYGGGIHLRQWSDGLIENNLITQNSSMLGAGIHITYTSAPTVRKNTITANTASGLGGGGIYIYYLSAPLVEQNLITQNYSSNGAGIGVYWESNPTIRNNIITKNFAGAGIRIVDSVPVITNNIISYNEKDGIQYENNASPVITNSIIISNGGKGINASSITGIITYNNVWGHSAGNYSSLIGDLTGINDNISAEPEFIDSNSNDYHLNYFSPCINAGDPNTATTDVNDFDGQPRLAGQFVDIGAYEAKPVWNITKDKQYSNIQAAIDDANNNQTIVLTIGAHKGTGNKNIDFKKKAVTVRSINPNDSSIVQSTVIDCEGQASNRAFQLSRGEDANSVIDGLTITNCYGYYEGAIYCYGSSPTIKNCIIRDNLMHDRGSGISCLYGSNATVHNCLFINNSFFDVGYGGGIYCFDSNPIITNCIFLNNSAIGPGRHGGAVCCWGYDDEHGSNAIVANCLVVGNSADHRGGGLYAYWSSPIFVNCTVIGNKALEGGGIGSFRESNPLVVNCIVRNNIAPDGNQLALINTLRVWPWQVITEMTVKNSNIQGGQAGVWVDLNMILHWQSGNIDAEPNFVDLGYWLDANTPQDINDDYYVIGNYHLLPGSACINKGDNNSVPVQSITDIDSEQRIFDDTVDMGADEFFINAADFNGDGIVDFADAFVYSQYWLGEVEDLPADFVDDGFIDFADFAEFAKNWLWTAKWHIEY